MASPVLGIDLDNTLISYDKLFYKLALEQGLIPADLPANKTAVRDHLRAKNQDPVFTALQGLVYGSRVREAEAFAGALNFLREGRRRGWQMHIVSHKTKYPITGERVDLHEAALGWLEAQGLHAEVEFPRENVWFEPTKPAKIERIKSLGCEIFIDDLPELLLDPAFPSGVRRILFAPQGANVKEIPADVDVVASWVEIQKRLLS
jgi:hypothetical protein